MTVFGREIRLTQQVLSNQSKRNLKEGESANMEAISEATSSRTIGELENYLSSYKDLPREIILKHDLLRVGHWFTDAALELASQSLVKSYRLFSYDLMPMKDMKR